MSEQQATTHEIPKREFALAVEAVSLDGHRKKGGFVEPDHLHEFTVFCDEGATLGGANTAPPPIGYFLQAAAFCTLTQLTRYSDMMKVGVKSAKVSVRGRFSSQGSVLRETIEAKTLGLDVNIEVDSDDPPDRVAALIRNAEAGCFVMQAIKGPTQVDTTIGLNGGPMTAEA